MIRLDGLRIEEYLLICVKRSFVASCACKAFLVGPIGVVRAPAPFIAVHTNEPFGNLERDKCANTRVDSTKP